MKSKEPEQYISKDALVAEINRVLNSYATNQITSGRYALRDLLEFIDTIEVKEVDLEKEINKYICNNFFGSQTLGFFASRTEEEPNDVDIALCAKYFFELGLKAKKMRRVMNYDCTNCALRLICKKDPKPIPCYDWKAPRDMGVDHVGQINFK